MTKEEIELLKLAIELDEKHRKGGVVKQASKVVVDVVEAPFKIAGKLFDDLFGL